METMTREQRRKAQRFFERAMRDGRHQEAHMKRILNGLPWWKRLRKALDLVLGQF